jgi:hypothetical protein
MTAAAGLAAGAALGSAAACQSRPERKLVRLADQPGARVGATLNLKPFPAGTTYQQAVQAWNSATGTSMRCAKVYDQPSKFPTSLVEETQTLRDLGIEALISFKPSIEPNPSDRDRLAAAVKMFHDANLTAQVCLWNEVTEKDMTPAQYHDHVRYYGPVIRQYYPLVYDAGGYGGPEQWRAYDPGHDLVDGYAVDLYCSSYIKRGIRLDPLGELAGSLPVGVWEIGNSSQDNFFPTAEELDAYINHITTFLSGRAAGAVAWYNGPGPTGRAVNVIAGHPPNSLAQQDIAAYQRLYHALTTSG